MDHTNSHTIKDNLLAAITGSGADKVLPVEDNKIPTIHICKADSPTDQAYCGATVSDYDVCIYENVAYIEDNRADICKDCLCVYDTPMYI